MNLKTCFSFCFIIPFLSVNITTCDSKNSRNEAIKNIDTLIVTHKECTECLDAYIVEGNITLPKKLDTTLLYGRRDIILVGNSPYKNIKIGDVRFQGNFKIKGAFKNIDSSNAVGHAIVFKVINWEKL